MMTSTVVRTLERGGFLRRGADPGDARIRRLTPTPAGHRGAAAAVVAVETVDRDFFARAGPLRTTLRVLRHLAAAPAPSP